MKYALKFILFPLILFLTSTIYADEVSDQLTKLLLNTHSMQANFTQTVKDKSARTIQVSQGIVSLVRPGKFRWEIQKPSKQLIIANGNKVWIYDPDLQQVSIKQFSSSTRQTPAFLLSDEDLTLSNDFNVQKQNAVSQIANQQVFILTPKDKDNIFEKIRLSFIGNTIREMQLTDHLGQVSITTFQQMKSGIQLPASLFTFIPPKNVDVIDETKKN